MSSISNGSFRPHLKRFLIACCAVIILLGPALFTVAQTAATGTITGTVTDANKAVVAGANVTITDTDTGTTRTLPTNGDGIYVAPFLQPGHYAVNITGGGFGTVERKNLNLTVGQVLTLDAALSPASVTSQVIVTSESPLLDTEKTQSSQTIGETLVSNLPVNGRRWDNFVLLTPNVAPDGNSGLISYRGISGIYNTNLVDGANNNQAFFSEARGRAIGAPYVYSQDSIKEFQSDAAAYSAEFGQSAGGQINAITKSGTNGLHGDLFYYLRYPDLNALDPFSKGQGILTNNSLLLTQPVHQQQQFGGSAGGPIIKDKLFYFFTYDGFRKVNPIFYTSSYNTGTSSVASLANTCNGGTDYLTVKQSNGTSLTLPSTIPNISPSQCAAAVSYIQNDLLGSFPRIIKQDIFFPRLDYQLNEKNHLSASFNWENFHEPNGYNTSTSVNNGSVTQNGTANFHERFLVANWESVFSSSTVNAVHFQWSRDLETATTNSPGPAVSMTNIAAYGETSALPRAAFPDEHRWQITDVVTTIHGKHTLKAGGDVNLIHELLINLFQGDGSFSYSTGQTIYNFVNWIQDAYGVNGSQHYNNFTQVNDPITHVGKDDFWNKNLDIFAEDSWKLKPNFLVNAGLRYDVQLVPQPAMPNTSSDIANLYTKTINIDYHEFQPRLGFSWQPMTGTVVRGGYGLFYGLTSNSTYYTIRVENGVFQQQYNVSALSTAKINAPYAPCSAGSSQGCIQQPGAGTYAAYAPIAPDPIFTPPGPALAAPFAGAVTPQAVNTNPPLSVLSARGLDPHFLNPFSHEMDLTLEQQIPGKATFTLAWVANRGMRLPIFVDTNLQPATTSRTYDVVDTSGVTKSTVTVPFYTQRATPDTGSILTGFSSVNSWYNSMVVTIRRPFANGLEILANFTWAHALDGAQVSGANGTFNGTDTPLDPMNLHAEYGRSDLDMRGRFVGTLVYAPVFTHISSVPLRYAANGWSLSGTATEQTGFPVTAFMGNSPTSPIGNGGITGAELSLNNAGTPGRAPQVARNGFPGPGLRNIDLRVERNFPIHEQIRFQILGEAFNVVNHQNVLSVNTTAFTYTNAGTGICGGHANGCISPFTTGQPFGSEASTSSILYGPRQLQFAAKLFF